MTETHDKIIGIYHKDCMDGTTASAVLLNKFPTITLYPLTRGYKPEDFNIIKEAVDENTVVYIVDFNLNEGDTEKLLDKKPREIINIDHHISAKEMLENIDKENDNFKLVFDNDRSGASLTWIYFYGDENIPELIKLAEDLDLWHWKYGDRTKAFASYGIFIFNKPEIVKPFLLKGVEEIIEKGTILAQCTDKNIEKFIETAEETNIKIGDHIVRAYNAHSMFSSELGNYFSNLHNEAVALFTVRGNSVRFSLRSKTGQSPSALDLAQIVGGGGHRNASGARVSLKEFCDMIVFE